MPEWIAYIPMMVLAAIMVLALIGGMLPQSEASKDYDVLLRLAERWRQEGHPEPFKAALMEIHVLAALEKARGWVSERYTIREVDPRELAKLWLKEEEPIFAKIHGPEAASHLRRMIKTATADSLLQGRALELYKRRIDETVERVRRRYAGKPMPAHYAKVFKALREE